MRTPSPPYCGLDLAPPLADRFIMGMAPLDYGPVLLRMPFGSRLAADTLPSGCPCGRSATVGASPWLCPSFPTSCPCRVRHGRVPRPTRRYPRLWIDRPSFGRPRDLNPPDQNAAQHTLPAPSPPSRLRPTSRGRRLYGLPGSADFAAGRGGLLQLLDVPSSPCRRSHPAGASRRVSRCDGPCCLRPTVGGSASGASHFRGHHCVHLRYGPGTRRPSQGWPCRWASGHSVSLVPAIRATGVSALPPAGLTPAEHISLTWTHNRTCAFRRIRLKHRTTPLRGTTGRGSAGPRHPLRDAAAPLDLGF